MHAAGGLVNMVYLDFDKVEHGILVHKLKMLGITGNLGICFLNFLTRRSHFVRLLGAISGDSPVLSGVYQNQISSALLTIHKFIPKLIM